MSIDPKQARLRLGLTQSKMAMAMGCSLRLWQLWEYEDRNPSASARQLIRALLRLQELGELDNFIESKAIIV